MDTSDAGLRRLFVGVVAGLLLATAVLLWILPGISSSQSTVIWRGACGRLGAGIVALRAALPTRTRPAAWANLNPRSVAAVLIVALAIRIRLPLRLVVPIALVLAITGLLLRPRPRTRPPRDIEVERR
jgi:hypothetical protein